MLAYGIIFVFVAAALILNGMRALRHRSPRRTISVTEMDSVRELLSPQSVSRPDQLQSRALPNLRLIRAFALTNTFVSSSMHVHSEFTHTARQLIASATPRNDWRSFTERTIGIVGDFLSSHALPLDYSPAIQQIILRVVMHTLFGVPVADLEDQGISLIAYGINELWRLSKTEEPLPSDLLPSMNAYLHAWIPGIDNPLDFVIPTFETLWRVVAVTIASVHNHEDSRLVLHDFLHDPRKSQFDYLPSEGPSAAAIVAEVMRLYPPTKRISRASITPTPRFPFLHRLTSPFRSDPIIYAADIGAVQRDPAIWGPTANVFNPMRHHPDTLTNEQRRAMLGFGFGRLQCVASSWAPLAVGVITAAVLQELDGCYELVEGGTIGGREGWNDWKIVKTDTF